MPRQSNITHALVAPNYPHPCQARIETQVNRGRDVFTSDFLHLSFPIAPILRRRRITVKMPVTIDEIQQYESELRDYTRDAGSGFKDAVCREAESVLYGMELCVPRTSGRFGPSVKEGLDVVMSEDEMNLWKSWEDPVSSVIGGD